jgi:hypothetical protein
MEIAAAPVVAVKNEGGWYETVRAVAADATNVDGCGGNSDGSVAETAAAASTTATTTGVGVGVGGGGEGGGEKEAADSAT